MMRPIASRLKGYDSVSVWQEFSGLANQHGAVNLGQGFPDWPTPDFVKTGMQEAIASDFNQYCRPQGDSALVKSLAETYSPLFGRKIDGDTEVTVAVGATEALFSCMQAFLEEGQGDEVVMLEPAFDIYSPQVQMAGAASVFVTLHPPPHTDAAAGWSLDLEELEAAITLNTRILLLNTPHNPTGWVLDEQQAVGVAAILTRHPHVLCITDEVYEHLVYAPHKHVRLGSLPGMWDRVLTVSSAGKTFSVTGWKIGWVLGAAELVKSVMLCNQWVQFSVSTPAQVAIAGALTTAAQPYSEPGVRRMAHDTYFSFINTMYQGKISRLSAAFAKHGVTPLPVKGTYYVLLDISSVMHHVPARFLTEGEGETAVAISPDYAFARWLVEDVGICVIPCSAFYSPEKKHLAAHLVRVASCKTDETMAETEKRLAVHLPVM